MILRAILPYILGAGLILGGLGGVYLKGRHDAAAKWRPKYEQAAKLARSWEASFRKSEKLRGEEAEQARAAVNAQQLECDARVKEARKSAKVVREIVNAPVPNDANGCPVRPVVGADRLRDALQPGR